jgi:hypothetical protein
VNKPAIKQTNNSINKAIILDKAIPPIVSNGIKSAMGVTNFLKNIRALSIIKKINTIGTTKKNPPIRVVLINDVIFFIVAIFEVAFKMKIGISI